MSSSLRNLQTAAKRFEAAENSAIECIGVAWPQLGAFETALSTYIDLHNIAAFDDERHDEMQKLRQARHLLSRLPIHPDHELCGLTNLKPLLDATDGSVIEIARKQCVSLARELLDSRHPAAALDAVLRATSSSTNELNGRVALVAPEKYHQAIRDCVNLGQTNYELLSQTQLKRQGVWDVAVYLGPQYASYPGTPLELRKKKVAWMYSAPAALRTIQLLWSGHFDISEYTLWQESPLTLHRSNGPTRFKVFIDDVVPPPPPPPTLPPPADGVPGFIIDLAGGYQVALSKDHGPRPQVMQISDFSVSIEADSADQLTRGDTLLLRVDRTARDFVTSAAAARMGSEAYAKARTACSTFKGKIVEKASQNRTDAESCLRSKGIVNASYYLHACADDEYIAPSRLERYQDLCVALGVDYSKDEYGLFKNMRTAHRAAGLAARQNIQEQLKTDQSWEDETRDFGYCLREFPNIGKILITAIIAVRPQTVALNKLGRVAKDGRLVD